MSFLSDHVSVITVDVPPPPAPRHDATDECDGHPVYGFGSTKCPECRSRLCSCELAYGHDCEV